MGKAFKKDLDMLFFNLINKNEQDFLTSAIKIHLKKKKSGSDKGPNKICENFSSLHRSSGPKISSKTPFLKNFAKFTR